jgi:hypothetical protein
VNTSCNTTMWPHPTNRIAQTDSQSMRYRLCRARNKESDPLFPGVTDVSGRSLGRTKDYQKHLALCFSNRHRVWPRLDLETAFVSVGFDFQTKRMRHDLPTLNCCTPCSSTRHLGTSLIRPSPSPRYHSKLSFLLLISGRCQERHFLRRF